MTTTTEPVLRNPRFIQIALAVAAIYWLAEALVDSLLMSDRTFVGRLFPRDANELWMRTLTCMLFVSFGVYVQRAYMRIRAAERLTADAERRLQDSLARILSGYLPVCSWCKKIKNDTGEWTEPEIFITQRTDARLSHGICPSCEQRHFPDGA